MGTSSCPSCSSVRWDYFSNFNNKMKNKLKHLSCHYFDSRRYWLMIFIIHEEDQGGRGEVTVKGGRDGGIWNGKFSF